MVKDSIVDQHPFHAAILDLTIPGAMGGKEAVKAIYSIDANIKAIASSGYFDDPVMAQPGSFGFTAKIKKPYLIDELGEVLSLVFNKNG
jgi:CheY-like chemotaxis protein